MLEFARELADSVMWKQIFLFLSFKKTAPFPLLIDVFQWPKGGFIASIVLHSY